MSEPFVMKRQIEFVDTDMAGIVHFSNFFRYMEEAEVRFLRARGLSVRLVSEGGPVGFPRVAASCEYLRPARFEEVLDVQVTIKNLGRKSVTYTFHFSRAGEPIARGEMTSVCCRVHEGHRLESIEIPDDIRRRLASGGEP